MNWTLIFPFFAMGIAVLMLACDFAAFYCSLSPVNYYKSPALLVYVLVCAALIVPCGFLSDRFGRRKFFLAGLGLFALTSAIGAIMHEGSIAVRAVQGVATAVLWSSILGICYVSVPPEKKSFSMGLLMGAVGITAAAGMVFVHFTPKAWCTNQIMWFNVALALIAFIISYFKLHEVEKQGDQSGISFSFNLIAAALVIALLSCPFFAIFRYLPEYMQKLMGFTLYETSLGLTPLFLIWALVSPVAGDLYHHLGAKMIIFIASLAIAVGVSLLGFVGPQLNYYFLLPGLIISGLGYGFGFSSVTTAAMGSVNEGKASFAGAFVFLFFILGGALGLLVAAKLFPLASEPHLGIFSQLFERSGGEALPLEAKNAAYLQGFFWTMIGAAIPPLLGALFTLIFIKRR